MGSPESGRVKCKFSVRDTPSAKATHTELTPTEHDPLVQNLKGTLSEKQWKQSIVNPDVGLL